MRHTLGARDFSSAVSGFCQVFIVTRATSAYGRRRVGLRPTPKLPAAREKNLWYPGYVRQVLGLRIFLVFPRSSLFVISRLL